jgi:N utilization substance protein B
MAEAAPEGTTRRSQATAARLAAVQALYQVAMGAATVDQALAGASRGGAGAELDEEQRLVADPLVMAEIVRGTVERVAAIDEMIAATLGPKWRLERIEMILRAILRAGVFELLARPKAPARVVINEYVDIAHAFFDASEAGLVNAVLDRLAKTLRAAEFTTGPDATRA